jgi:hypothetical protein
MPKKTNAYIHDPTERKYKSPTKNAEVIVKIVRDFLVDSLISVIAPIMGPDSKIETLHITKVQFKYIEASILDRFDAQNSK